MTLTRIPHTELWRCAKCGRAVDDITHSCKGGLGDVLRVMIGCKGIATDTIISLNRLHKQWRPGNRDEAVECLLDEINGDNRPGPEAAARLVDHALRILGCAALPKKEDHHG